MAGVRDLRGLLRVLLRMALVAPVVALSLSVLVDRGPSGEIRLSRFPLALLAVDPLVGTCARNSILFAGVLAGGSLGLGLTLGWVLGRRSFWGRPLLRGVVIGSLAASPAFMALGLLQLFGSERSWPWPIANIARVDRGVSLESWAGLGVWLVWLWSSLPAATALVAAVAESATRRLEPSWDDAARLAGATAVRTWRTISWPLIRPAALRATAVVFVLGLVEPGAPLVLGLRRTLAYQRVDAASRPAPFPGISAWCLLAGLIAVLGAMTLRRVSGTSIAANAETSDLMPPIPVLPRPASPARATGSIATLFVWCVVAWLPVLGLARSASGAIAAASDSDRAGGGLGVMLGRLGNPLVRHLFVNSALVGLEVAGVVLVLCWLAGSGHRGRGEPQGIERNGDPLATGVAPPLLVGVGVLAFGWTARVAAGWLLAWGPGSGLAGTVALFTGWIAASAMPSLYLPASIAWVLGPLLFLCWRSVGKNPRASISAIEAARLAGASRLRGLWLGDPSLAVIWFGRFVFVWTMAATNLTPALLASPGTDGPTLAPGVLVLADGGLSARALAACAALGILALQLAALAFAWICGSLPRLARHESL
jgi:iron(III) transport system permease protein